MSYRETYNGWANWPTYKFALVFDNSQGLYNQMYDKIVQLAGDGVSKENAKTQLAEWFESYLYEVIAKSDILLTELIRVGDIDFDSIAANEIDSNSDLFDTDDIGGVIAENEIAHRERNELWED